MSSTIWLAILGSAAVSGFASALVSAVSTLLGQCWERRTRREELLLERYSRRKELLLSKAVELAIRKFNSTGKLFTQGGNSANNYVDDNSILCMTAINQSPACLSITRFNNPFRSGLCVPSALRAPLISH